MPGMRPKRVLAAGWTAWALGAGLLLAQSSLRTMHPHFAPLLVLVAVQAGTALLLLIHAGFCMFRTGRRRTGAAWGLLGLVPLWLWAAHIDYSLWRARSRSVTFDLPMVTAGPAGAALLDGLSRAQYPRRVEGARTVMVYREAQDAASQVAAMDAHLARLESLLQTPIRTRLHWIRGPMIGLDRFYFQGCALVSPDGQEARGNDGLSEVDRHEAAHFALDQCCSSDIRPPTLLFEGWAEAQAGYPPGFLAERAWMARLRGESFTLAELTSDEWYGRMLSPVYDHGGPLVDYLLRTYGPAAFLELFRNCRPGRFADDCQRVLGVSLDELDRQYWSDIESQWYSDHRRPRNRLEDVAVRADVDGDVWKTFVNKYPSALERLKGAVVGTRWVVEVETATTDAEEGQEPVKESFESGHDGDRHRVIRSSESGLTACIVTPEQSFALDFPVGRGRWQVNTTVTSGVASLDFRTISRRAAEQTEYLWAAHRVLDRDVFDWMMEPDFIVTGAREIVEEDVRLVQIEFASPRIDGPDRVERRGLFIFLPDELWALRGFQIDAGGTQIVAYRQYSKTPDGKPILSSATQTVRSESGKPGTTTRTAVKEVKYETPPPSDFLPRSFGLSDRQVRPSEYLPRSVQAFLLAAGGSEILGMVLLLVGRKKKGASAGTP
jgi:hypothetical protein